MRISPAALAHRDPIQPATRETAVDAELAADGKKNGTLRVLFMRMSPTWPYYLAARSFACLNGKVNAI